MVLLRFSPRRESISLMERFPPPPGGRPLPLEDARFMEGTELLDNDKEDESAPSPILIFGADINDTSDIDFLSEADTFRNLTVFISLRKAAILSGAIPIVGLPDRRDAGNKGLMGFSTGIGAWRSDARAEAKREGLENESLGRAIIVLNGGGGGGLNSVIEVGRRINCEESREET